MKKILLVALIALCSVSFSFGAESSEKCLECLNKEENAVNCVGDCSTAGKGLSSRDLEHTSLANVQKPADEDLNSIKLQK